MQEFTAPVTPIEKQKRKGGCFLYGFAIIGVFATLLFACIIAIGAYLWVADPFGLRVFFDENTTITTSTTTYEADTTAATSAVAPSTDSMVTTAELDVAITPEQEALLSAVGLDIETLAAQDPVALEACVSAKVGAERSAALQAQEVTPGIADVLALKSCIK